jgi:hypothetical protein
MLPENECEVAGHAVAPVDWQKGVTATASSFWMSKTVYSFVICIRSVTLSVRLRSFSSPPCFRALVKELTSASRSAPAFFAKFNPSADVHNRDTTYLPRACRHFHGQLLATAKP